MKRWLVGLVAVLPCTGALAAEVTLVSPGEGELRVLQLGSTTAREGAADFSMDMATTTAFMGQQVEVDVPVVAAGVDIRAQPTSGGFAVTFAYRDVTVGEGDAMGKMVADPLARNLEGVKGTMTVTPEGEVLDAKLDLAAVAAGAQQPGGGDEGFDLAMWVPRLPTQPVGVGASWTTTEHETDARGFTWDTSTSYRLLTLEGSRATIAIETERRSPGGTMTAQGMALQVKGIVTRGAGTSVVLLNRPFPEAGAWHLDVEMLLTVSGVPTKQTTSMDIKLGARAPQP